MLTMMGHKCVDSFESVTEPKKNAHIRNAIDNAIRHARENDWRLDPSS
jgi:hypothetical protein